MSKIIEAIEQEQMEKEIPPFAPGDTVIVQVKVKEGERERLVTMEGRIGERVIGQTEAIEAVSNAVRRARSGLQDPNRPIGSFLFLGPTGVGKTEIARRLAKLAKAPFLKIEATKFTEVGYVGRDVESIIRDLMEISLKLTREAAMEKVKTRAEDAAEERILDILLPPARDFNADDAEEKEIGDRVASIGVDGAVSQESLSR